MDISDKKIVTLRAKVTAARQEFDMAVSFHETWKPAAFDHDLHRRMGESYATNTFLVIRMALRREMLLALVRLWDKDARAVGMEAVAEALGDGQLLDALAKDRATSIGMPEAESQMRVELGQKADKAILLVRKYSQGGSHYATHRKLRKLRNVRLAHRQSDAIAIADDPTDEEIESFYRDMSELICLLLGLVMGLAYDPGDAGDVYRHHAKFFWVGVCGERTQGHPSYKAANLKSRES